MALLLLLNSNLSLSLALSLYREHTHTHHTLSTAYSFFYSCFKKANGYATIISRYKFLLMTKWDTSGEIRGSFFGLLSFFFVLFLKLITFLVLMVLAQLLKVNPPEKKLSHQCGKGFGG